jgi:hypothetical protein
MDSLSSSERIAPEDDILSELAACEERIAQLELQLAMEYELKDTILQGIENEGFIITTIPASSFPNEILLQIFDALVEDDSLAISNVLLVCQKWHQLAMGQESLWSRLSFRVPETRALKYLRASQRYTDLALLRSGERLLDITIDFRSIRDLDTVTFKEACVGLPKNVADFWLRDWRNHPVYNGRIFGVFSEITQTLFTNFIRSLMGAGIAAHRWRTLTFKTRSDLAYIAENRYFDVSKYMFNRHEMPILERVDLLDYNARHMDKIPSVKHLLIHSRFLLSRPETHFGALECLHLRVDSLFPSLKPATRLRFLSVDIILDITSENFPRALLGSLEALSIRGPSAHALLDHLEMPRLRILQLVGKDAIQSTSKLDRYTHIESLHILAIRSDAAIVGAFLMARVAEISASQRVVVMPWHFDTVVEWIRSRRGKFGIGKKRPGNIQTVEWIVQEADDGSLEEKLWRLEVKSLRYQTHHLT